MTDDEARRIRSYLQAQAAKLSPPEIVEKVRGSMADVRTAVFTVPTERFTSRPSGDEWSANEVMAHIVRAGAHFGGGIVRILDGGSVEAPVADRIEAGVPERTATEWWNLLEQDRAVLFERIERVDPGAHLDRTITHSMFGPLTWREALLFMRLHDLDHAGQLRQIAEVWS
jgi:hypothetical protein